jgi:hypothetical protein
MSSEVGSAIFFSYYFFIVFLASELELPWEEFIMTDGDDKTDINPSKRAKTNKK